MTGANGGRGEGSRCAGSGSGVAGDGSSMRQMDLLSSFKAGAQRSLVDTSRQGLDDFFYVVRRLGVVYTLSNLVSTANGCMI